MANNKIEITGLRKRWLVSSLSPIFVVALLIAGTFCVVMANYYYNTNKAWIPGKHMEKLEKFLSQREKRVSFSREILYNNPNENTEFGR